MRETLREDSRTATPAVKFPISAHHYERYCQATESVKLWYVLETECAVQLFPLID